MPDIIADFHGTLYQDANEGPLWKHVAKEAVTPLWEAMLLHPLRTVAFARAKPVLEELVEIYERGEIGYDIIYEAYNRLVLALLPIGFVHAAIRDFGALPGIKQKLDGRVLTPIKRTSGKKGILSTGSKDFIVAVLRDTPRGGYPRDLRYYGFEPDTLVANGISQRGEGTEFQLNVYGNKPQVLEQKFFRELRFNPRQTVYLGDNADEEPAFEYVISHGGRVVVPFYAADAFKQHAATRYKAEVPANEQELSRFLQSLKA